MCLTFCFFPPVENPINKIFIREYPPIFPSTTFLTKVISLFHQETYIKILVSILLILYKYMLIFVHVCVYFCTGYSFYSAYIHIWSLYMNNLTIYLPLCLCLYTYMCVCVFPCTYIHTWMYIWIICI